MKLRITSEQEEHGTRYCFSVTCPHLEEQVAAMGGSGELGPPSPDLNVMLFVHEAAARIPVSAVLRIGIAALDSSLACDCLLGGQEVEG